MQFQQVVNRKIVNYTGCLTIARRDALNINRTMPNLVLKSLYQPILDGKEREAKPAMRKYPSTETAQAIHNLHAYALVFQKNARVRKTRSIDNGRT